MSLFDIKTFAEWDTEIQQLAPPRWLIENFLQADSVIQVSGQAKISKKTWFALVCAICVASGKKLGYLQATEQAPVLIIEHEDAAVTFHNRFKLLERGYGLDFHKLPLYIMHRQSFLLENEISIDELRQFISDKGIKLVLLDTFVKSVQGDENDATIMTKALRQMDKLRIGGASVMYLHHLNKPQQYSPKYGPPERDIDHEVRGSSALGGNYDQHFALRQWPTQYEKDQDGTKIKIENEDLHLVVRSKSEEEKDFKLQWTINGTQAYMEIKRL